MAHAMRGRSRRVATSVLVAVVVVGALGCGGVRARRQTAEPSGFLGDYSRLEKVQGYDFQQMYIASGVDWSDYHAIHLDSVTLWAR